MAVTYQEIGGRRLNPENEIDAVILAMRREEVGSALKDRLLNSGGAGYRSSPYNLRSHSASPKKNDYQSAWPGRIISRFDQENDSEDFDDSQSRDQSGNPKNGNSNIQKLIDEVTKKEEKWTKE